MNINCQDHKAKLFFVATPIGHLADITLRALEILKEVDLIACEDTRETKKLLNHFNIFKPLISYHQHSGDFKIEKILEYLASGKNIAVVSDAGTPGISDPGNVLARVVYERLSEKVKIIPIPGVSALITLASVAGVPTNSFLFLGFLPHKKGRQTLIKEIIKSERTVIFYESVHRISKALEQLKLEMENQNLIDKKYLVVGRELTKFFETIYRGNINEVIAKLSADKIKGEFVVIVSNR